MILLCTLQMLAVKTCIKPGSVSDSYKPINLRGRNWEDFGSRVAWAKSYQDPQ
jgi:hypothetical protein